LSLLLSLVVNGSVFKIKDEQSLIGSEEKLQ